EDLVRRAVVDRRLDLHYQPIVDLLSGQVVGAEALLRLRDDDGRVVSPLEFIPIAEEIGMIGEIGACVLVEACRAAAGWQALRPLPVDELKIDRAFIAELGDAADEAPLVDAILAMAASLGLSVIAEGIETQAQAEAMQRRGCTRAQGYLYARPLRGDEVVSVL